MKIVVVQITDSTNRALGFSLVCMVFSLGGSLRYRATPWHFFALINIFPCSSFIGGGLARPGDRFPNVFTSQFWKQYPYFLPCLVVAMITIQSFLIVQFLLKEVVRPFLPLHLLIKVLSSLNEVIRVFHGILSQIPRYNQQKRITPLSKSGNSSHTRL